VPPPPRVIRSGVRVMITSLSNQSHGGDILIGRGREEEPTRS
ncbi:unnamed protein product, partial [marine sediment metagenome]